MAEHKFPFSLVNASKREAGACKVERMGDISDQMDKSIGRRVIKISGTVSANNYIDFSSLHLVGKFFYVQLKLLKSKIATIHFELITMNDISLRISVSTLYAGEAPRYLGRCLR